MDHLKLFNNHSDYEAFVSGGTMVKPNVSHCIQENEVHYNPYTYTSMYFTTIALESGTISFDYRSGVTTTYARYMEYSSDGGTTWTRTNNINNQSVTITVNVSEGDKIMWRGDNDVLSFYNGDLDDYQGSFFSSTCEFDAMGNIMSLLYSNNFEGQTVIENDFAFFTLFCGSDVEKECGIVNAKHLVLPATTLTEACYSGMFIGCRDLITAPELLPATTLSNGCYGSMFDQCTNLITAPELPATTLAEGCYYSMFGQCESLTTAPQLPATTLDIYCYIMMFYGCTGLTEAPELPATTLVDSCYNHMFDQCTNLNSITCLATDISASNCTTYWLNGVAASGTFTKAASATNWRSGTSGIPSGWTVVDAS